MKGEGFLHGQANEHGLITGHNISYIYPDGETAFKGYFENSYMKKAFYVDVKEYGCDENGMFIVKKYSGHLSDQEFYYEHCTNESFGGGDPLHIRDPYEGM